MERAIAGGELGLQVAAFKDGELIVNAWAGELRPGGPPVDSATLFPIFSITKAITATAVHIQVERGLVDYDAPIARYWPEYAMAGKEGVTIRHVLCHRAGVPQMPVGLTLEQMCDWDWMVAELAAIEPVYEPGTHNTYLSMTFGWLLGEVVRRTDPKRRPFEQFLREEVLLPLDIEDLWVGLPLTERPRVAQLSFPDRPPLPPEGSLTRKASPPEVGLFPEVFNLPEIQAACLPSVGAIGSALAVARFFSMLAGRGGVAGKRLLSEGSVLSFLEPRPGVRELDETYGMPMPVGVGGYWISAPGVSMSGPLEGTILCHPGAGGTIAWADIETGLAAAICHNRMVAAIRWEELGESILDVSRGLTA